MRERSDIGTASAAFRARLGEALRHASAEANYLTWPKHVNVYNAGDPSDSVYFLTSGRVKLVTLSQLGKECLLTILAPGQIFGELSLGASCRWRLEAATTMEPAAGHAMAASRFHDWLAREHLHDAFMQHLIERLAQQQQLITHLATIDSQRRLGHVLLLLARTQGRPDTQSVRLETRISHEELSQMVGTTRPRVTTFLNQFRSLGLVEMGPRRQMIVQHAKLAAHLDSLG